MKLLVGTAILLLMSTCLTGCNRQYLVTVNEQAVYDPRIQTGLRQLNDPDLQGCINLALSQQDSNTASELGALSCTNAGVTDLRGIGQFRNIRFLDLAGNNISDLQPLASLPQLSGLNISDNPLTDISPLLTMDSLTAVILSGNNRLPCSQLDRLGQRLGQNLTRPQGCQN